MADTDINQTSATSTTPPTDTEFQAGTDLGGDTAVEFAAADVPMDDEDALVGGNGETAGTNAGAGPDDAPTPPPSGSSGDDTAAEPEPTTTTEKIKAGAQKLVGQAGDRARGYAEDGKAKAGGALDELAQMMTDAAGSVDEKLGEQYGKYARTAADAVSGFSGRIKDADIDELVEDVRDFVTKSPAVAIGAAAAIGFVLVRLIRSGLDPDHAA